ncbi:MAG TPA: xanthine dehydrogenase family protein molybdopterin-binding subunit [Acidimicrobiales bacterium]|jgi:carbon-monoxide dehydrogenase large subunit|nr:xanthine dehydrogenase family protein molybdopterin-binding subunit [Acidimicrobiales bacterium]
MSLMGTRVLRVEDPRLLRGDAQYLDDVRADGDAAHVAFVRSTAAHARLRAVHATDARAMNGVIGVFTFADLGLAAAADPDIGALFTAAIVRPWLADGTVRFVGEPIAAVVADTRAIAIDAAQRVVVDYDPLPAVVDADDALRPEAPLLFPDAGTNVVAAVPGAPTDDFFADCDVVVRARVRNSRVAACPLEPRGARSRWEDGRLLHLTATQRPHGLRDALAGYLGIAPSALRLRTLDVGGGFGARIAPAYEEVVTAALARVLDRPLYWHETRSETLQAMGHGRAQWQHIELGGTRDGTLVAYRLRIVQESGAYPDVGAILPMYTALMAPGVYDIPKVAVESQSVVTNTAPVIAFRGAGRPEATAALERAVDCFAHEIGMDPIDVRRRNVLPADVFPHTTPTGGAYDSGAYLEAIDRALDAAGYADLRAEQAQRRARRDPHLLGIGTAVYVEITNAVGGAEFGSIEIARDGGAVIRTGVAPTGQGHATTWAMIAADRLGIPFDAIRVEYGDTDLVPFGRGTMGSSSLQVGGVAVANAADALIHNAKALAARLLEAHEDDIVVDAARGRIHVTGTPSAGYTWAELAVHADEQHAPMEGRAEFTAPAPTFPFGVHVAVVEIDAETGAVTLQRLIAVDDAGTVLHPDLFEGQLHGGIAQGAAQALLEEIRYDTDGNLLTSSFADYAIVSAAELPSFELITMETPTPHNALGAKGIGESGTIGATPAVQNAVVDALAHLGVRHLDMPLTPERVWRAINESQ